MDGARVGGLDMGVVGHSYNDAAECGLFSCLDFLDGENDRYNQCQQLLWCLGWGAGYSVNKCGR